MKLQVCYEVPSKHLRPHKRCVIIDTICTMTRPELEKTIRNRYNASAQITSIKEII